MSDDETHTVHQRWRGSTLNGGEYNRDAEVHGAGKPSIPTSVAASYGGDEGRLNPEDLYAAALSTCLMHTFLALAKKARVDVVAYDDTVTVWLVTEDRRTRIDRAVVSPTITVSRGSSPDKAETMFHKAHKYCVIANSSSCEIVLEPVVRVADQRGA